MAWIIGFLAPRRKAESVTNWELEERKTRLSDMRWLWRLTRVVALFAILLLVLLLGPPARLLFCARVAKRYSQTPDTKLAMPVENVSKRAIADTWEAPRGTNRHHEGQDIFAPRGTPILSANRGALY